MDEDRDVDLRKPPTMVSAPSSHLRRLAETTTGGQDTEGTKASFMSSGNLRFGYSALFGKFDVYFCDGETAKRHVRGSALAG